MPQEQREALERRREIVLRKSCQRYDRHDWAERTHGYRVRLVRNDSHRDLTTSVAMVLKVPSMCAGRA